MACTAAVLTDRDSVERLSNFYNNRAIAQTGLGQAAASLDDSDRALRLNPNSVAALQTRGTTHANLGHADKCLDDLDAAIRLNPKLAVAYDSRGVCHVARKEEKLALQDFQKAVELDSSLADSFFHLAAVHYNRHDYAKSLPYNERALALAPKSPTYLLTGYNINKKLGNHERALHALDLLVDYYPKHALFWNCRCWERAEQGRMDDAMADCQQALKLKPNLAEALDTRAVLEMKLGRVDEALRDFEAALKIKPEQTPSLYGRGLAKRAKNDAAGGDADIAAALKRDKDVAGPFARQGLVLPKLEAK